MLQRSVISGSQAEPSRTECPGVRTASMMALAVPVTVLPCLPPIKIEFPEIFFPDLNKNRTQYINKVPDMNKILDNLLLKLYTKKTLDLKYSKLNIIVKFSGIWKTNENYGLTYKFSY